LHNLPSHEIAESKRYLFSLSNIKRRYKNFNIVHLCLIVCQNTRKSISLISHSTMIQIDAQIIKRRSKGGAPSLPPPPPKRQQLGALFVKHGDAEN
jgi:hypothetical protein